jgi:hypothetical protein
MNGERWPTGAVHPGIAGKVRLHVHKDRRVGHLHLKEGDRMSNYKIIAVLGATLLGSAVTYFVIRPPETFGKCVLDATRGQTSESLLSAAFYCSQRVVITWLDWYHVFGSADYSVFGAFIFASEMKLQSTREHRTVLAQLNAYLREKQIRQDIEGGK